MMLYLVLSSFSGFTQSVISSNCISEIKITVKVPCRFYSIRKGSPQRAVRGYLLKYYFRAFFPHMVQCNLVLNTKNL